MQKIYTKIALKRVGEDFNIDGDQTEMDIKQKKGKLFHVYDCDFSFETDYVCHKPLSIIKSNDDGNVSFFAVFKGPKISDVKLKMDYTDQSGRTWFKLCKKGMLTASNWETIGNKLTDSCLMLPELQPDGIPCKDEAKRYHVINSEWKELVSEDGDFDFPQFNKIEASKH